MSTASVAGNRGELRVYGDAEQLAGAAAELFVALATESIKARGRFRGALSDVEIAPSLAVRQILGALFPARAKAS